MASYQALLEMGFDQATAQAASAQHPNDVSAAVAAASGDVFMVTPPEATADRSGGPLQPPSGSSMLSPSVGLDVLSNANNIGSNYGGVGGAEAEEIEEEAKEAELIQALQNYVPSDAFQHIRQQYLQTGDPLLAAQQMAAAALAGENENVHNRIIQSQGAFLGILQSGLPTQSDYTGAVSPSCRTPVDGDDAPQAIQSHDAKFSAEDEANISRISAQLGAMNPTMIRSVYLQCDRNPEITMKILAGQ